MICSRIALGSFLVATLSALAVSQTQPTDAFLVIPHDSTKNIDVAVPVLANAGIHQNPITDQWLFDLPGTLPGPVRSIAFRRKDSPGTAPSTLPAANITLEMWMGQGAVSPSGITFERAANRQSRQQVVAQRLVRFPAVPWRADNEYPFSHRIPLDQPFSFQPNGVGLIEIRWLDSDFPWGGGLFDGVRSHNPQQAPGVNLRSFGSPCPPPSWFGHPQQYLAVHGAVGVGNHARAHMVSPATYSPRGYGHLFFAGLSDQHWGPLSLPFDLGGWGAPTCNVYSSLEWTLPQLSDHPEYEASADMTIPNDSRLIGAVFYVQGVFMDPAINALGIATSNAWRVSIARHVETRLANASWGDICAFSDRYVDNLAYHGPKILLDAR